MRACQTFWPVLSGSQVAKLGAVAALLLLPAMQGVCADTADRDSTEREEATLLKTRVDAAWKSSMVCCNGRCYRRRGPYYVEEYTNVHAAYDNPSNPKEFTVIATVRMKDARDGWSPPLPDQPIMKYRIIQRSNDEWEFAEVADTSGGETSRIECDQLAFLDIAQCSCASAYSGVGTRNRTAPRKASR